MSWRRICLLPLLLGLLAGACASPGESGAATPIASATPTPVASPTQTPTTLVTPSPSPWPSPTATPPADEAASYSRRTAFVPLDNPQFLAAQQGAYLQDTELVLGLEWKGEARAYPIRMLHFHHIVNDTVSGKPFLVTY